MVADARYADHSLPGAHFAAGGRFVVISDGGITGLVSDFHPCSYAGASIVLTGFSWMSTALHIGALGKI